MPSQEELNERFSYDPLSGILTAKKCYKLTHVGDVIGKPTGHGYLQYRTGKVRRDNFLVHRIIWTMLYGPIPKGMVIDHINGDGQDNRLANLRLATVTENNRNAKRHSHNTSGVMGVRFDKRDNRWDVSITIQGKKTYVGRFKTMAEAVAARKRKEAELGFHPNHGRVVELMAA